MKLSAMVAISQVLTRIQYRPLEQRLDDMNRKIDTLKNC
jgi:hypothetical protein